jgi:hypothetical protein
MVARCSSRFSVAAMRSAERGDLAFRRLVALAEAAVGVGFELFQPAGEIGQRVAGALRHRGCNLLHLEAQLRQSLVRVERPAGIPRLLDEPAQPLLGLLHLRQVVGLARRLRQPLLQRPDGVAGARLADLDVLDDVAQRPFERAIARHVVGPLRRRVALARFAEALGHLFQLLLHGAERARGVVLMRVEPLDDGAQLALVLRRHGPERGVAVVPRHVMELVGDLLEPQRHVLAVALLAPVRLSRPVGRAPVAPFEVVVAVGGLQDHAVEPFADGHARLPRRLLGGRAGLLLDALDAPRDTRLHVTPLSLVDAGPSCHDSAGVRACCT